MRLTSSLVTLLLLCIPPLVSAFTPADTSGTDRLARTALHNVRIRQAALATASTCTLETASVRKEWDSLCADEKRAFIAALLCLQSKPAISGHLAPGARSRYDDFLATHINQTTSTHGTVCDTSANPCQPLAPCAD
jgi:tyrosinase